MVLGRTEIAAEGRWRVEKVPEARAHHRHAALGGLLTGPDGQVEIEERRGFRERGRELGELEVAGVADVRREVRDAVECSAEVDDVGVRRIGEIGRWTEQQPVDDAEHRRVGADA